MHGIKVKKGSRILNAIHLYCSLNVWADRYFGIFDVWKTLQCCHSKGVIKQFITVRGRGIPNIPYGVWEGGEPLHLPPKHNLLVRGRKYRTIPCKEQQEEEFLDTNLKKKTRVSCSLLFSVPSTGWFYIKWFSTTVFKSHPKNLRKRNIWVHAWIAFCRMENRG